MEGPEYEKSRSNQNWEKNPSLFVIRFEQVLIGLQKLQVHEVDNDRWRNHNSYVADRIINISRIEKNT